MNWKLARILTPLALAVTLSAQIYNPKLLRDGQPDSTNLPQFVQTIYRDAGARTQREKAAAIWRFFLTDGRYVKPGFWYHIAGWSYEEPTGEVLDPMKLLNSYGFGLCYHIAPLLEAAFEAGGFEDARCWFLTGHTVAEVFYGGSYHYFDSDMMGYNVAGQGSFRGKPVVNVRALERDRNIILGKLEGPNEVIPGAVDNPWYPADVQARAMGDLADLFATTKDNYVYPSTRYAPGHSMDFVLRRGEKLIRFFEPEEPGLFYLPYKFDGAQWTEFPREISQYHIRTADGPRSQKDNRSWATGRIEYTPPKKIDTDVTVIDMPSPYVIIDAQFKLNLELAGAQSNVTVETSIDGGRRWQPAGERRGPFNGGWTFEPAVLASSEHGKKTAVSGTYGYRVRITKRNAGISRAEFISRIQVNPRSLPAIRPGENEFVYSAASPVEKVEIPAPLDMAPGQNLNLISHEGQAYLQPAAGKTGEVIYALDAGGRELQGIDAGARFITIRGGLAPNKLTAETRHVARDTAEGTASLSWSTQPDGPFRELWHSEDHLHWRDGDHIDRTLLWPEVFRQVRDLPPGTKRVYVKMQSRGPASDSIRLAVYAAAAQPTGTLTVGQVWTEGGVTRSHVETMGAETRDHRFTVKAGANVRNRSITLSN